MDSPFTVHAKANEITIDDLPFDRLTLEEAPVPMDIQDGSLEETPVPMEIDGMDLSDTPSPKRRKTFHCNPRRLPFTDPPDAQGIIDYRTSQRFRGEFYSQYQNQGSSDSPIVLP